MDAPDELERKQRLLLTDARAARIDLRLHPVGESVLECIFARGDRALADVIEHAWANGARFDAWEDQRRLDVWRAAFDACGVDRGIYTGEIPVGATLPWGHISVGLAEGFLEKENARAHKRLVSPPCGKQHGRFAHPTTSEDASADRRPLVCYDCGVSCDLDRMRENRIDALSRIGAPRRAARDVALACEVRRYRFRFEKTGPAAMLGHLDLVRTIPRALRRAGLDLVYSAGFHPKPELAFSPALSLGVSSLAEIVDVKLRGPIDPDAAPAHATRSAPRGLVFTKAVALGPGDEPVTRIVTGARYYVAIRGIGADELEAMVAAFVDRPSAVVRRGDRDIDVRPWVTAAVVAEGRALEVRVAIRGSGGVKISEVVQAITGRPETPLSAVRTALYAGGGDSVIDPLDVAALRGHAQNLAISSPGK